MQALRDLFRCKRRLPLARLAPDSRRTSAFDRRLAWLIPSALLLHVVTILSSDVRDRGDVERGERWRGGCRRQRVPRREGLPGEKPFRPAMGSAGNMAKGPGERRADGTVQ